MTSQKQLWQLKIFLFFIGAINTFVISYFPLYFQHVGLTKSEIGSFLALGTFFGLVGQPLWGLLSDTYNTVKKILILLIIGSIIGLAWIFQLSSLLWIFVAGSFFFLFYNTLFPLSENLSKRIADQEGLSFGELRSWPAFGFALFTLVSGFFFARMGIQYLWIPMVGLLLVALAMTFSLQDVKSGSRKINYKEIAQFLKSPTLLMFFGVVSFISLSHRMNDSFISIYLLDIGGNETLVGWLWFIAVLSEAFVFLTSRHWFRPDKPIHYLILAGGLYLLRWVLMAFVSDPIMLLAVQILHGVCYGVFFMGAIEYLYRLLPKSMQATGHMAFMLVVFGTTGIIGSSVGGAIFENLGGTMLYWIMALLTSIGIIGLLVFNKVVNVKVKVVE